ncbi:MAG: DUF4198 domain-containing protein [Planctomycetaceae bacterium]|nr:DUF4198 domain-containing protein [Planctomycetaceae bacterium]MCB9950794.1 DUF4198 domain-containing protein [Planctomycetaceae bacterium]
MKSLLLQLVILGMAGTALAHDTWVETNTNVVRVGDAVHISFKLGNHGNDHRDFKLAGKPKPETSTLSVIAPDGSEYDLISTLIDEGYTPGEGFFSTRFKTGEPGLYMLAHRSDAVVSYAPKRSVKSAKTFFVASKSLDTISQENPGFDRILNHELELIPRSNPVTPMGPGQTLDLELRFKGKPLSEARVSFIPRGVTLKPEFDPEYEQQTDSAGRVQFEPKGGNVYLIVAHHEEPDEAGEGFTSTKYSATLTLFVPEICPCCGE